MFGFSGPHHHRHGGGGWGGSFPYYSAPTSDVVLIDPNTLQDKSSCPCSGSLAAQLKQNPLVFVIGAAFVAYLLAKKR